MSAHEPSGFDLQATLAQIERNQAETAELKSEIEKLNAEAAKLAAERHKLNAEANKLASEARTLDRDRGLAPWQASAITVGSVAALVASIVSLATSMGWLG